MEKTIRTVPAILTDDPAELEKLVRQAESFTSLAQMDIMDGRFVPSRSVSGDHIAALKTTLTWEAHLMVMEPEKWLVDFQRAGASKIVFHHEATASPEEVIRKIKELGIQAGLAVNPETPIQAFQSLVEELDSVLFLSVNPGYYGSPFIPEVLDKITAFRRANPTVEIGIDGGIKEDNITEIAGSGVDIIYIGSAIFRQPDPAAAYRRLTQLARAGVS